MKRRYVRVYAKSLSAEFNGVMLDGKATEFCKVFKKQSHENIKIKITPATKEEYVQARNL